MFGLRTIINWFNAYAIIYFVMFFFSYPFFNVVHLFLNLSTTGFWHFGTEYCVFVGKMDKRALIDIARLRVLALDTASAFI